MTSHQDALEAIITAAMAGVGVVGYRDPTQISAILTRIMKPIPLGWSHSEWWRLDIYSPTEDLLYYYVGEALKFFNSNHRSGYDYTDDGGGADDPAWMRGQLVFIDKLHAVFEVEVRWVL